MFDFFKYRRPTWVRGERFLYSLLILLVAHGVGDYALQTSFMARNKVRFPICFAHATVWTGVMMLAFSLIIKAGFLWDDVKFDRPIELQRLYRVFAIVFLFLLSTHLAIDLLKAHGIINVLCGYERGDMAFAAGGALLIDQVAHFMTLMMSYWFINRR